MCDTPEERAPVDRDWYATAFGALYPIVYAHRTVAAAAPEARFAMDQTGLDASARVLDLCCGNGRHLVHVLGRTPHATGFDYSPDLLTIARRNVDGRAGLVRGDMRAIPFDGAFDVVLNFFTSFGYFQDPEENMAVARGIARALKPGGRFFIDHVHAAHVEKTLVPHSVREQGEYVIADSRWIDEGLRRVNKCTRVSKGGRIVLSTTESVRLYAPEEMAGLLGAAGLELEQCFGDYDGAAMALGLPRMILVGRGRRTDLVRRSRHQRD